MEWKQKHSLKLPARRTRPSARAGEGLARSKSIFSFIYEKFYNNSKKRNNNK